MQEKRHSLAHLLAIAVLKQYPDTKIAIGPAIDNGFYYDFEFSEKFEEKTLPKLEKEIIKLISQKIEFKKEAIKKEEVEEVFKDQPYKLELLSDLDEPIIYRTGEFVDLCEGPHVENSNKINPNAFKLTRVAGAYWKGDEKNKMLTRIYGVAFETEDELKAHLEMLEEAEKRNHRKIGKEMELFVNLPEVGQGLPIWLPKGYAMRRVLEDYMLKLERSYGYEHILSPHINKAELFETSGHLGFYKDSMYAPIEIDNETFYLKPMNCPVAMMVFKMKPKSYKNLPIKWGELGTVYRYERSGELHGLQRVRGFTQNDAHIFCTSEQLEEQFLEVLEMLERFYKDLGFDNYRYRLSLSGDDKTKYVGKPEDWDKAEETLRKVLTKSGVEFREEKDEAAFYGPKLDVQAINVFGKEDSISTIQIDFNLAERFDLEYIDQNGEKQRPFVIHRALIGSFERFFAFLIEYYAGKFPTWIAPVQIKILSISDKHKEYTKEVYKNLLEKNFRVELDVDDESLGKKIRNAKMEKVPYLLILGDKELEDKTVTVENRERGNEGAFSLDEFIEKISKEITLKN
ncbi:threonine--tRNA ligase [Patescibacteria group bacterium]|nr:threonine--tRNA ligase [Patescibacteria group bacterium]